MRWSCVHRFGSCRGEEGKLLLLCSLRCHPPSDAVMLCLSPQRVLELVLPRPSLGRKLRMGHRVGRLEAPTCPSLHSAVLFPGDLVPGRKMQMSFRSRICFPWWFAMSVLLEREFSRLKSRLSANRNPRQMAGLTKRKDTSKYESRVLESPCTDRICLPIK